MAIRDPDKWDLDAISADRENRFAQHIHVATLFFRVRRVKPIHDNVRRLRQSPCESN